jgi:hypothetical protein
MIYGGRDPQPLPRRRGWQLRRDTPGSRIEKIAEETGGGSLRVAENRGLNSTFTRVADKLHRQYVLGFTPEVLDNKLHKLDLKVKIPGMTARALRNYLASRDRSLRVPGVRGQVK